MATFLRNRKLYPLYWSLLAALALAADYLTGPLLRFPIFFVIPVALASWHNGRGWGFFLSICLPLVRLYYDALWDTPWTYFETSANSMIRIAVLSLIVYFVDKTARQTRELRKEVKILSGILPICSFCKKIRTAENEWVKLEDYISEHSESEFSHGLCQDCLKKHYGDYVKNSSAQ